jgi:hypothetical protein
MTDNHTNPFLKNHHGTRESSHALAAAATAAAAAATVEQPKQSTASSQTQDENHKNSILLLDSGTSGVGQWHSWTRNFASPLLALLDLLDNAFDAATVTHPGKIHICPDHMAIHPRINKITGIAIWNSSVEPIKPLRQVLGRHLSLKGDSAHSIGQNGIGLKQGCATLSDLSFCLSKNRNMDGTNQFGVGILALSLQSNSRQLLPSIQFQAQYTEHLTAEMMQIFGREYPAMGKCVAEYGGGDGQLYTGIQRLVQHFRFMTLSEDWKSFDHVFGLVIYKLKHGSTTTSPKLDPTTGSNNNPVLAATAALSNRRDNEDDIGQEHGVKKLLGELEEDLSMRYLHIPQHLEVKIGKKRIHFNYWQPKLVEMTKFDLHVDTRIPVWDEAYGKVPPQQQQEEEEATSSGPPHHTLRVYMGFDALRVDSNVQKSVAQLYIYSRTAGRLICKKIDCRGDLELTSGSTDYCQGLTIIVDDKEGALPLNPTKQDLAFSERANGELHRQNMFMLLSASTRFYYRYYKEVICDKSKKALSECILKLAKEVKVSVRNAGQFFRPLDEYSLNTFLGLKYSFTKNNGVRLSQFKNVIPRFGEDVKLRLPRQPTRAIANTQPKRKRKASGIPRKQTALKSSPGANDTPSNRSDVVVSNTDPHSDLDSNDGEELASDSEEPKVKVARTNIRSDVSWEQERSRLLAMIAKLKAGSAASELETAKREAQHFKEKCMTLKKSFATLKAQNDALARDVESLNAMIGMKNKIVASLRKQIVELEQARGVGSSDCDDDCDGELDNNALV